MAKEKNKEEKSDPCVFRDCKYLNTEGCRVKNLRVSGITKCAKYRKEKE